MAAIVPLVCQNHTLTDDERKLKLDCAICFEPLINARCVSHAMEKGGKHPIHEEGGKHPIHEACIAQWVKVKNTCPLCRAVLNISFFENRIIVILKKTVRVARQVVNLVAETIFNCGVETGRLAGFIVGGASGLALGMAAGLLKITLIATQTERGRKIARIIDPIFIIKKGINSGIQIGASGGAGLVIGAGYGAIIGVVVVVGIIGTTLTVAELATAIFIKIALGLVLYGIVLYGSVGAVIGIVGRGLEELGIGDGVF